MHGVEEEAGCYGSAGAQVPIAIVGMGCRLPGADTLDDYWRVIREARDALTRRPEEARPGFQPVRGLVSDRNGFDAALFGMHTKEAIFLNPQHRLLLETSHEALENAAIDPLRHEGRIATYMSCSQNLHHEQLRRRSLSPVEESLAYSSNYAEYAASRIAYRLNLRGESMAVQTACSSSLVAVHLACRSLTTGSSDVALAGGVNIGTQEEFGYRYQEGLHFSASGVCRPFDARADGMISSDGVAVVVLRRLEDALADGDPIWAVIRGTAINNDGRDKMSYTAPSVSGHAAAIRRAWAAAGADLASVSYLEAHGTGTALGDPIEIAAFSKAFGTTSASGVALGSVKGNIGHTVHAAGAASLIKLALMLAHRTLPACAGFEDLNPEIDLGAGVFRIPTSSEPWRSEGPRMAGISSLGFGGTNAHMVLEEAPSPVRSLPEDRPAVLPVSANTAGSFSAAANRLADALEGNETEMSVSAVAETLQEGRSEYDVRGVVVARNSEEAARKLREMAGTPHVTLRWRAPVCVVTGAVPDEAPECSPLCRAFPAYAGFCREGRAAVEQLGGAMGAKDADAFVYAFAGFRFWKALGVHGGPIYSTTNAIALAGAMADDEPALACARAFLDDIEASAPRELEMAGASSEEGAGAILAHLLDPGAPSMDVCEGLDTAAVLHYCKQQGTCAIEIGPGPHLAHLLGLSACLQDMPVVAGGVQGGDAVDRLLAQVADFWRLGARIDWTRLRGEGSASGRVHLPGYVYERRQYRIADLPPVRQTFQPGSRAQPSIKQGDVADWFHRENWSPVRPPLPYEVVLLERDPEMSLHVVFGGQGDLSDAIAAALRASTSGKVVRVGAGESLKEDGGNFTLPPDDRLAYRGLFERLTSKATRRVSAICLWPLEGGDDVDPAMCVQAPLALAAELQHLGLETDLLLVTQSGARISPDEPLVPACAASAAVVRGIGQECRTVHATALDLEAGAGCGEKVISCMLDQLCAAGERSEVALRGRSLWAPTLVREAGAGMAASQLCERGDTHVILGGTGHVGLSLAQRLATSGPEQRIILVCRSGEAGEKALFRIEEMRGAGAEVSVIKADITDRDDVLAVLRKAGEQGGRIAHVVHAAGVVDPAHLKFIRDTGTELAGETIAPHVAGAEALAAAVDQVPVDKVVLCSSLSSFVGGLSYAAHAAGHRYLDAVGLREGGRTGARAQWVVIDYDTWLVEERASSIGSGGQTWAILPDEGWEVFSRACAMGSGRYAISTPTLGDRPGCDASDLGLAKTSRSRPAAEPSAGIAEGEAAPAGTGGESVAETVTVCFEEVLGMTDIDPQANFFELGGESLLMLDFIDLVKARSGIVLPQADAFNALTLSDMIALCEKQA